MSLRGVIAAELAGLPQGGTPVFDAHAHTGADIDGTTRTAQEHLRELETVGGRSVIFPLCVTGGYAAENRRVLEECTEAAGRLTPFARLDPKVPGVRAEAEAALGAGAAGFKLHPRAEAFGLDHPGVEEVVAVAASARAPVLIHAGLGVGSLGETIVHLAQRYRECPLVLAHAAISDLTWLWQEVPSHPNLFFDTSWWNASDLIALYSLVPPGRILFGSDVPYMDLETVLAINLRCARFCGLSSEAVALIAGSQLQTLLAGKPAIDAGPAPGPPAHGPSPLAGRATTALIAAAAAKFSGGDPAQMFELARLAVADGSDLGPSGPLVADLLDEGAAVTEQAAWALAMAVTVLLTPEFDGAPAVS